MTQTPAGNGGAEHSTSEGDRRVPQHRALSRHVPSSSTVSIALLKCDRRETHVWHEWYNQSRLWYNQSSAYVGGAGFNGWQRAPCRRSRLTVEKCFHWAAGSAPCFGKDSDALRRLSDSVAGRRSFPELQLTQVSEAVILQLAWAVGLGSVDRSSSCVVSLPHQRAHTLLALCDTLAHRATHEGVHT